MTEETFCQRHKLDKPCVLCEKEETLSDKIFNKDVVDSQDNAVIRVGDVKDFIRKVKNDITNMLWLEPIKDTRKEAVKIIDKLAGDDLIHSLYSPKIKDTPEDEKGKRHYHPSSGGEASGTSGNEGCAKCIILKHNLKVAQDLLDRICEEAVKGSDNQDCPKSTMYIVPCKKDLREELNGILGKKIMLSVGFDKWNNYLMLETTPNQNNHSQKSTESKQTPTNAPIQGGAGCKSSGASDNQNYTNNHIPDHADRGKANLGAREGNGKSLVPVHKDKTQRVQPAPERGSHSQNEI
jgi:hypothetical protein